MIKKNGLIYLLHSGILFEQEKECVLCAPVQRAEGRRPSTSQGMNAFIKLNITDKNECKSLKDKQKALLLLLLADCLTHEVGNSWNHFLFFSSVKPGNSG